LTGVHHEGVIVEAGGGSGPNLELSPALNSAGEAITDMHPVSKKHIKTKVATAAALVAASAAAIVALSPMSGPRAVAAEPGRLAVVELFTSQGCSSCPPADANVAALSNRPDVLALSFGVTYWDHLGWKDTFAKPAYTERQRVYERALHHDGSFTPQVVVDGRADVVGIRPGEIEQLIARESLAGGPDVRVKDGAVVVGAGRAGKLGADVWLVRYDPNVVNVPIRRGENGGRTLPIKNVVRSLDRIGRWSGAPTSYHLPPPVAGLRTAVLVQDAVGGPILSALRL
jgi:hypothetical protein